MKNQVRQAILRPEYNVASLYSTTGVWQYMAKNIWFEYCTLGMIALNSCWLAVDADLNQAQFLVDAPLMFQVADNMFCVYFVFEWVVRFLAFDSKRNAFHDRWFLFDTFLVFIMVAETWAMSCIFMVAGTPDMHGGSGFDASIFKVVRVMRLTRMGRIVRLLRAFPELLIMIKGLAAAGRSVVLTLALLMIIIYVFAITFRQLTSGTDVGNEYFRTVLGSMNSLLLRGTLPDMADIINECSKEHFLYGLLFLIFVLLGYLTVMNMLVGVLVEVVSVVSSVEKEEMNINIVKSKLSEMLCTSDIDTDVNGSITKATFETLLMRREAAKMMREVGVDVLALFDLSDFIFKDGRELEFADFCELVLQFRESKHATVKDIVDMRKFVVQELDHLYQDLSNLPWSNGFANRHSTLAGLPPPGSKLRVGLPKSDIGDCFSPDDAPARGARPGRASRAFPPAEQQVGLGVPMPPHPPPPLTRGA